MNRNHKKNSKIKPYYYVFILSDLDATDNVSSRKFLSWKKILKSEDTWQEHLSNIYIIDE